MASKGTVLITGASGYVGGQVVREALSRGYNIKATARSESSTAKIAEMFPSHTSRISFAIVPDMTVVESYKDAFAGVTGVLHIASPFVLSPKDVVAELLDPAVKGTTTILEAAKKFGPEVQRVVITSSHAAVFDMALGLRPGYVYSEKDFNPVTWDEAAASTDGSFTYCASKALAERAAWEWMDANKASIGFDLATINPPWIFGPYATQPTSKKGLSESIHALMSLIDADKIPPPDFCGFADVREVAFAHLSALEVSEAGGRRWWVGQEFNYQRAVDAIRAWVPEIKDRIPEGTPGQWEPMYIVDGSKAARELGLRYRVIGETMRDTFEQVLKLE